MSNEPIFVELKGVKSFAYWLNNDPPTEGQLALETSRIFDRTRVGAWPRSKPDPLDHTPYTTTVIKQIMPQGVSTVHRPSEYPGDPMFPSYTDRWIGPFHGGFPGVWFTPSEKTKLVNEALIDALQTLKDQKFNAGVAIAEANGLARMVHDAGTKLLHVRNDFVRGRYKQAYRNFRRWYNAPSYGAFIRKMKSYGVSVNRADTLRKIPNSWLYYHFGIKPTLDDINGAVTEYANKYNANPEGFSFFVKGKASHVVKFNEPCDFGSLLKADRMNFLSKEGVRIKLQVRVRDGFKAKLTTLGMTNVPEALWNRVPWSWAADYFTSFGDWLSVLDAGMGYEFADTIQSHRRKVTARCDVFTRQNQHARVSSYNYTYVHLNRQIIGSLYPPMYRVIPMAKLKGPSVGRISKLASALVGSFGGHGR